MKKIHLPTEDITDFFTELYLLQQANIPEQDALQMMAETEDNKNMWQFLTTLINAPNLLSGLEQFPTLIPEYITTLLRRAKKNHTEAEALADIAEHLNHLVLTDNGISYREKLKTALLYPAVVLLLAAVLIISMMIFVIPVFAELFKNFGTQLPILTLWLFQLSNYVAQYLVLFLIVVFVLLLYFNSTYSKTFKSRLCLQLPVIGRLTRCIESAAIVNTLQLLCHYQFSLAEALRLSASATQNTVIATALSETADNMSKGEGTIESLVQADIFPAKTVRLLAVFETTQQLQILKNLAQYHDKQIPRQTTSSLRMLNILLTLICWFIVGTTVIAVYLPLFQIGKAI